MRSNDDDDDDDDVDDGDASPSRPCARGRAHVCPLFLVRFLFSIVVCIFSTL